MLFDLLNIKPPEWHRAFIDGRRLTSKFNLSLISPLSVEPLSVYRKSRHSGEMQVDDPPHRQQETLKLTDQYIALLILIFTDAGLLDVRTMGFYRLNLTRFNRLPPGTNSHVRRIKHWLCADTKSHTADG